MSSMVLIPAPSRSLRLGTKHGIALVTKDPPRGLRWGGSSRWRRPGAIRTGRLAGARPEAVSHARSVGVDVALSACAIMAVFLTAAVLTPGVLDGPCTRALPMARVQGVPPYTTARKNVCA